MPLYSLVCPKCKCRDTVYRPMSESNAPEPCRYCSGTMERDYQAEQAGPPREYREPIHMHSIALNHEDDVHAFIQRNPGIDVSTDKNDPLFGVPVARTRQQKLSVLKAEGYEEKN